MRPPSINDTRFRKGQAKRSATVNDYYESQRKVDDLWRSPRAWAKMAMINTAKMAWFSSDRSIAEYAAEIWKVPFDAVKRP